MPDQSSTGRWSRESRLLLLTVAVCAGVLLVLARLRFPEPPRLVGSPPPLERLAARASYDALAGDIQRIEPLIGANLVVLRVASQMPATPRSAWEALTSSNEISSVRHIAALRTGTDTAMAAISATVRIEGIVGDSRAGAASLLQRDPVRDWAVLRVPAATAPPLPRRALSDMPTPSYVVVVEGTQAGATLRPVFLGQGTRFTSVRWSRPLLPLGGIAVSPGALLFTLDGEFVGAVAIDGGAPAVVGERDLFDTAARLATTSGEFAGDIGVAVQSLTSELGRALSAAEGVVVSDVEPDGPSASILEAGDVLTAVGARTIGNPDEFLLGVAQRAVGERIEVTFVRAGESRSATVSVRSALPGRGPETVALVRVAGAGTQVEIGSQLSILGLQAGDLVTRAGTIKAPTPEQLRSVVTGPSATGFATLFVQRDGRQRVIAVPVSSEGHAGRR